MTQDSTPQRRAVVLGASNVFRNISTVVATAQSCWGRPLELLIAAGHGRSYGMWNQVLGYSVPGIVHCGLWEALAHRPSVPTAALLTDVGNDLLYGASPETILGWVETCLERLQPQCERISISELPLCSVARLAPAQFVLLSRALFPKSKLTLDEAIDRSNCLNDGLIALAKKFSTQVIAPEDAWYGFDPIHLRRRCVRGAWQTLLSPWNDAPPSDCAAGSLWQWCRLRARRTHVQRFLGREYHTVQPALCYADGSTVSLY